VQLTQGLCGENVSRHDSVAECGTWSLQWAIPSLAADACLNAEKAAMFKHANGLFQHKTCSLSRLGRVCVCVCVRVTACASQCCLSIFWWQDIMPIYIIPITSSFPSPLHDNQGLPRIHSLNKMLHTHPIRGTTECRRNTQTTHTCTFTEKHTSTWTSLW